MEIQSQQSPLGRQSRAWGFHLGTFEMTNGSLATSNLSVEQAEGLASESNANAGMPRQQAARQIAIETKRLWREAQLAGLDDLALMEQAFYRAYQEAGGAKVMRAV
jgi:hypothetical protein